jgi:lipopolysaccharide export LptBFGC system permease protein LptF
MCLFIFIDVFINFGKIEGFEGESRLFTIVKYYSVFLPELFNMSSSFIFCLACTLSLAVLEKNSQLIAIHASKISIFRIISLLLCLSLGLGLLQTLNNSLLIPMATKTQIQRNWTSIKLDANSPLNYRDPTTVWHGIDKPKPVSQAISQIYIEGYQPKDKTFQGVHAIIMDKNARPLIKVKGKNGSWNSDGEYTTNKVMSFSYELGDRLYPYPKLSWSSAIPLENIYYSRFTKKSLTYSELNAFQHEISYASERFYRLADGFLPFLMILITSITALPFIYKKPLFAYLSCLATTMSVFLIYSSLKTEFEDQELGFLYPISTMIIICLGTFLLRYKKIPT